jgi:aerobic carbon-monoxide dehydrogenase medium subunit
VIASFDFHTPATFDEALELLEEHGEEARPIAGGTALVILMRQRLVRPRVLVSLARVDELRGIERENGTVRIGAMATHREVETSAIVHAAAPLLADTLRHVATIRIRNIGTLGGNLAHADPSQDPPVALIAQGATVTLARRGGTRTLPVEDFFTDYYETVLEPGELLASVAVPELPAGTGTSFLKFLPRSADDYATVAAAAAVRLDATGQRCEEARVAVGSAAAVPVRARRVEDTLVGRALDDAVLREAAAEVRDEVDPIADARGTAEYKRDMAEVFVRRALRHAAEHARRDGGAA